MDLSNLSSTLPPTQLLELASHVSLNHELTGEFKNAARSVAALYHASSPKNKDEKGARCVKAEFATAAKAVASLYRLGSGSHTLLMHKGYLECLDDLLTAIAGGDDIENWALTKRAELTNFYNHKDLTKNELPPEPRGASPPLQPADWDPAELVLPAEHEFSFPPELASHTPFRPSLPPLLVSYRRSKLHMDSKHRKLLLLVLHNDSNPALLEAESDTSDSNSDHDARRKRKALRAQQDAVKRRRRDKRDGPGAAA